MLKLKPQLIAFLIFFGLPWLSYAWNCFLHVSLWDSCVSLCTCMCIHKDKYVEQFLCTCKYTYILSHECEMKNLLISFNFLNPSPDSSDLKWSRKAWIKSEKINLSLVSIPGITFAVLFYPPSPDSKLF